MKFFKQNFRFILFVLFFLGRVCVTAQQTRPDSSFWLVSLPELQNYKAYYLQELESLQQEKYNLIQKGIEDGERLLSRSPDPKVVDDIIARLADLYYYKEKDVFLEKMWEFDGALEDYQQGKRSSLPEEPRLNYQGSLELYQRIIDEYPQSELVDDAIYNKGFLYEEMGDHNKANQIYRHLIDAYPNSQYVPESYMRLGEYYFNPPQNDVQAAGANYEKVLEFKDNPRYDEALYKLGWCHYRLSEYPESISYFTTLIESFKVIEKYDPERLRTRADLVEEAVAYISISFIDYGGTQKCNDYLKNIGKPKWGEDVLMKLGDVYMMEKEEYMKAAEAFNILLDYAPISPQAPLVQKKIVECYLAVNDESQVFDHRHKLFMSYQADGVWWKKIGDEKAKLAAYQLAEEALRHNINHIIKKAEELNSNPIYKEAVDLGYEYLDAFPEDLNAYMVRWNVAIILDTKLHDYKQALQEYLTISMVYTSSRYEKFARDKGLAVLKDAAENAIVVADSLVKLEWRMKGEKDNVMASSTQDPIPLSTAESWLAMAYDNYIKRFPFDKNTPTILANTGALYYTHNQFSDALRYFKTLTKYFPRSEQVQNVKYSILESYFGKKDYESAEILAKRILDGSSPAEIREKTAKRLGEAIFMKAQVLADEGKTDQAADEFYRMALEVPTLEFTDRALFNAGREYEKLKSFTSAIRAYELLRATHSSSPLYTDALNNLAFDYGEIGDFQNGAERYESLHYLIKDPGPARDALYNAVIFYEKAQNWGKAVTLGKMYAGKYPEAEDAPWLYFKTAEFALNLFDKEGAIEIYSTFSTKFPDSPVGVEAAYRLGELYEGEDDNKAEKFYYQAHLTHLNFKNRGLEGNDIFACEGIFKATRIIHGRFQNRELVLPQSHLAQTASLMQLELQQLVSQYTQVISYRTHRLPETLYRLGESYEDYAHHWANQEIPQLDPTARAVKEKEINSRTSIIYSQALSAYQKALQGLEKVLTETEAQNSKKTTKVVSGETFTASDSLIAHTRVWLDKVKGKVSETLYQMAEVNTQSVHRLLKAPIPGDLSGIARLEYRNQVLLRAIKPLLDVVVEAHRRNLLVSDSLSLKNRWSDASRSRILASLELLGKEYQSLSLDAMENFSDKVRKYREATLERRQDVSLDDVDEIVNLIDLAKTYSQVTVAFYKQGILDAEKFGVTGNEIIQSQDRMIQYALQAADSFKSHIQSSLIDQQRAEERYLISNDIYYEDCLAVFEDNVYFLTESARKVLETTYQTIQGFKNPSPLEKWIRIELVWLDPDEYKRNLNIPVENMVLQVDSTWWSSSAYHEGWEKSGFNAELISEISPVRGAGGVYIRKEFAIPGMPVHCGIAFKNNPPTHVYLNGIPIHMNPGIDPMLLKIRLNTGHNLFALEFFEKLSSDIVKFGEIRYIPSSVLPNSKERP